MGKKPKATVREAVQNAKDAVESGVGDAARETGPDSLRRRFKMLETGLHVLKDDRLRWIADSFDVIAETRDTMGNWGLQLAWRNRDGEVQEEIFGRELFAGDCKEVRLRLAAGGLTQAGDHISRQEFVQFLNLVKSPNRAQCVTVTGWHIVRDSRVFVLPEYVVGDAPEKVILQSAARDRAPFNRSGTIESWKARIGKFSILNSRLIFSICVAFAGPLLDLVSEDGGGWNLKGPSRVGKTTALRVAASVWGGDKLLGSAAFIRSWRATSNGLESVAAQYSDTFLPLDEMGQIDARDAGDVAYMLSNGSGKARAGRDGGGRAPARWRLMFLSTGEVGLADKALEAKLNMKAGAEIRLLDVQADAGAGLGLYEELHGEATPDRFADMLRLACREHYGTAGPALLEWLIERLRDDPEFTFKVREDIEATVARWLTNFTDTVGQVRSVARRYALAAVAGTMATRAGITGWLPAEAEWGVKRMFDSWLAERGSADAGEDIQARRHLAAFITRHGSARFELWGKPNLRRDEYGKLVEDDEGRLLYDEATPSDANRTQNRVGWRRVVEVNGKPAFEYYLPDAGMREVLTGLDFQPAIRALCSAGMIVRDKAGKSTVVREPPFVGKAMRLYLVPGHVLEAGLSGDPD